MSGRRSAQIVKALKDYWTGRQRVYALAKKYGVAPSTIYRALDAIKKGRK